MKCLIFHDLPVTFVSFLETFFIAVRASECRKSM